MNRKEEKGKYIALGILISMLISFIAELLFMALGKEFYFSRSYSGLKYQFLLLPFFIFFGIIFGYLFWFFFKRGKKQ